MNIAEEIKTITPDEYLAAFKASRLRFTSGYGLFTVLQIPHMRRSLELHALAARKNSQQPKKKAV